MRSLIIGAGQIGSALYEIFGETHETSMRDIGDVEVHDVEILHIAFPYSEDFVDAVKAYIEHYNPRLTIIHSSVKVGTTRKIGGHVVHSPERGRYPNLAFEMRQFPKFVGGLKDDDVHLACDYFELCGWKAVPVNDPNWTELCKLLSNAHLGLEIAWRQEVERFFNAFDANPIERQVYDHWEDSYNKGHRFLGHAQLLRPRVRPDPIGGHCILPCTQLLLEQVESEALNVILKTNEQAKKRHAIKAS